MKISTKRHSLAIACALFLGSFIVPSCSNDTAKNDDKEVAELQKQLDSTMKLYEEVKSKNSEFDDILASRDSAINAQAAEIQSLINQLNSKKTVTPSTVVATATDKGQMEKQQKEIREKENTIKQLQKQIDQQSKQIASLQSGGDQSSADKSQINKLQKQISQQEKQIKDLTAETERLKKANTAANCDQMKKGYESQVAELNGEVNNYKGQIRDLHNQIKSLKAEVASLQKASSSSDTKNAEELKAAKSELTKMTAQLNECRKQSKTYQDDLKELQSNLESSRAELSKCQSDLAGQVAQVKSLQSTQSEGGKTEQQLRSEISALVQKEAACRAQNEELTRSHNALKSQCESDKQALQSNIKSLQDNVASLQKRVDQLSAENKSLAAAANQGGSKSDADAKTIAELNAQVESQRAQIAKLQSDLEKRDKELAEAKASSSKTTTTTTGNVNKKLAELQALCDSYVAEIERLRAENAQLKDENAQLKDKVASSADLFAENERLKQKVTLASVLVTSDINITPAKSVKTGNVVKETNKASQTMAIRIDCKLIDNNVVDPGSITIYARIATANNHVICNGAAENYSFDLNGVQMQYTTKQDIEFTGYGRNITMLWRKSESLELTPGLYWVTLYANGYEIGKKSFKLE